MYPETNTLPKQPYPVRSAAGLVDFKGVEFGNLPGAFEEESHPKAGKILLAEYPIK
jgi:hypothetical protein